MPNHPTHRLEEPQPRYGAVPPRENTEPAEGAGRPQDGHAGQPREPRIAGDPSRTAELVALGLADLTVGGFAAVYLAEAGGRLRLEGLAGEASALRLESPPRLVQRAFARCASVAAGRGELAELARLTPPSVCAVAVPITDRDERLGAVLVGLPTEAGAVVELALLSKAARLAALSLVHARSLERTIAEARLDPLTGLGNHRAFHEHVDGLLRRARAGAGEVALVLFDLDDFKRINDREGHLVGDRVLRAVAQVALRAVEDGEQAFRMGGEEFVIVVEGGPESGERAAERLRAALAEARQRDPLPSISAGIASFPRDARAKDELIQKADFALYAAKESGKDKAVLYRRDVAADVARAHEDARWRREADWWRKVTGNTAAFSHPVEKADGPGYGAHEVVLLAERVGARLGLFGSELHAVGLGALLNEVGKLRIPEWIREKPGPLTEREWEIVRTRAEVGAKLLAPIASLHGVLPIVQACRERWDGTGPGRLAGEETPLGARIVAVCDAFCAMVSPRPYRESRTRKRALLELAARSGTQFDPACVEALFEILEERGEEPGAAGPPRAQREQAVIP